MKSRSVISIGPGASSLILIFVVLALSILGMLSLMTARNDLKFSERYAEVVQNVYRINELAEQHYAEADRLLASCAEKDLTGEACIALIGDDLPEEMTAEEDEIFWTEELPFDLNTDPGDQGHIMSLDCAMRILPPGSSTRSQWVRHDLYIGTEEEWNWSNY